MFFIRVSDNVRCAVEDINPSGNHPILFVHGWPLARNTFEYQFNVLPNYGIRCIAYDMRGYGDSDKPFHGYSYDQMADDLHRIIQSINCRSITLLGFSMGGAISIRYMARYKGFKVNRLILCGAAAPVFVQSPNNPCGMSVNDINNLITQTYNDRQAMTASFGLTCFAKKHSNAFMQWFTEIAWRAAGYSTIKSLKALRDENLQEDLCKIDVPTLILHGLQDRVCPFTLAEEMYQAIHNSTLIPFEESGHCLFYDEKDKFNDKVLDFLKD